MLNNEKDQYYLLLTTEAITSSRGQNQSLYATLLPPKKDILLIRKYGDDVPRSLTSPPLDFAKRHSN